MTTALETIEGAAMRVRCGADSPVLVLEDLLGRAGWSEEARTLAVMDLLWIKRSIIADQVWQSLSYAYRCIRQCHAAAESVIRQCAEQAKMALRWMQPADYLGRLSIMALVHEACAAILAQERRV